MASGNHFLKMGLAVNVLKGLHKAILYRTHKQKNNKEHK